MTLHKFGGFLFSPNQTCLICNHVFESRDLVKIAVHDQDGLLQFLCGKPDHNIEDTKVVGLDHLIPFLPGDDMLPNLPKSHFAEQDESGRWIVKKFE